VRIGREIVPEVLQVDALAPRHERQRDLAVEMKVPEIPQEPHVLPVADSRQEGIHQHDTLGSFRILRGKGISHHHADVVADDGRLFHAQRPEQPVDVARHGLLVVAAFGLRRIAGAAQVGNDHGMAARQDRQHRVPHAAGLREAMQEHHRRAGAADPEVESDVVESGIAFGERAAVLNRRCLRVHPCLLRTKAHSSSALCIELTRALPG